MSSVRLSTTSGVVAANKYMDQNQMPLFGRAIDGDVTISGLTKNINTQIASGAPSGPGGRTVDAAQAQITTLDGTLTVLTVSSTTNFRVGDVCLVICLMGSTGSGYAEVGNWERVKIASVGIGTITLSAPLKRSYGPGNNVSGMSVMIQRIPEYRTLTLSNNAASIMTANAFNGSVGGVLAIMCRTLNASTTAAFSMNGGGYRGGTQSPNPFNFTCHGEGLQGVGSQVEPSVGGGQSGTAGGAGGNAPSFGGGNPNDAEGGGGGGGGRGSGGGGGYGTAGMTGFGGGSGGGGGGGSGFLYATPPQATITAGSAGTGPTGATGGPQSPGGNGGKQGFVPLSQSGAGGVGGVGGDGGPGGTTYGGASIDTVGIFMGGGGGGSPNGSQGGNGARSGGGGGGTVQDGGSAQSSYSPGSPSAGNPSFAVGGNGGGIVLIWAENVISVRAVSNGANSTTPAYGAGSGGVGGSPSFPGKISGGGGGGGGGGAGGGGAGGSIIITAHRLNNGFTSASTVTGGAGVGPSAGAPGGSGVNGGASGGAGAPASGTAPGGGLGRMMVRAWDPPSASTPDAVGQYAPASTAFKGTL